VIRRKGEVREKEDGEKQKPEIWRVFLEMERGIKYKPG